MDIDYSQIKKILNNRELTYIAEENVKEYAVLIPVIELDNDIKILFERRSTGIKQPKDISFPGGRLENGETYEQCAIRETVEELLISKEQIEIIGRGDTFISQSSFLVHSFIGKIKNYDFTFCEDEVSEIIAISLSELLKTKPRFYKGKLELKLEDDFPYELIEGGKQYNWHPVYRTIVFYRVADTIIWGMTAKILQSVLKIFEKGWNNEN